MDNANTSSNRSEINKRYFNKNYTAGDSASWTKFNGNNTGQNTQYFKIKEYEVWRVIF